MTEDELDKQLKEINAMRRDAALISLCRGIFEKGNLLGADLDDVQVFEVTGRDFPQQPDGSGLHISFSISNHALPLSESTSAAIRALLPNRM